MNSSMSVPTAVLSGWANGEFESLGGHVCATLVWNGTSADLDVLLLPELADQLLESANPGGRGHAGRHDPGHRGLLAEPRRPLRSGRIGHAHRARLIDDQHHLHRETVGVRWRGAHAPVELEAVVDLLALVRVGSMKVSVQDEETAATRRLTAVSSIRIVLVMVPGFRGSGHTEKRAGSLAPGPCGRASSYDGESCPAAPGAIAAAGPPSGAAAQPAAAAPSPTFSFSSDVEVFTSG